MWAVLLAFGAAIGYAAASVLQHREAEADTELHDGGVRLVLRLARRPLWLAGLGCDGLAYVCQALALGLGALLVVQPVITSGILFALPASAWWAGRKLTRSDYLWAALLALGLTVFLGLAGTGGGRDHAGATAWLWCAAIAGPVLIGTFVAATRSTGTRRAVLFAFTCGALFGITAALTKATVVLIGDHGIGALTHWPPYALAAMGALGFVLNQRAFQAGSLTASLPTLTVVEPLVAALVGILMLDETVSAHGVFDWVAIGLATIAMIISTVQLSRSAARLDEIHEHEIADVLTRDARARHEDAPE
jgi:drug/metabolite transporter (DMT)-like permease